MQISGCSGQNWSWEELHRNRQISADYLRCGNRPYPARDMRVTALVLSQRRIRRYFVLPLKAAGKQRDLSHVRSCEVHIKTFRYSKAEKSLKLFTLDELRKYVRFGNALASLCVERKGAIPAMPSLAEVEQRLER